MICHSQNENKLVIQNCRKKKEKAKEPSVLPLKLRSEPWKALSESHIVGGLPGESYAAPLSIFLACTEKHKSEVALHMQMCQKRKKL